jgi:hypothetical protein
MDLHQLVQALALTILVTLGSAGAVTAGLLLMSRLEAALPAPAAWPNRPAARTRSDSQ